MFFERKKKPFYHRVLKLPFYVFVAWALGFGFFWFNLPKPNTAENLKADAVVVLTGGPGRLDAGVQLLAQQRATKMLVSGVHRDVVSHELSALTGAEQALFDCCVTLDYAASNTLENAVETAKWTESNNITSLILVTADYHVQRSVVLFRKSMPNTTVIPFPVKSGMPLFKLAKEYNKYLATLILELVGY